MVTIVLVVMKLLTKKDEDRFLLILRNQCLVDFEIEVCLLETHRLNKMNQIMLELEFVLTKMKLDVSLALPCYRFPSSQDPVLVNMRN